MLSVSFECFGISENVKSSLHCNILVFIIAFVLSKIVERLIFLSDQIIFFLHLCTLKLTTLRDNIAVNPNYKVSHNSTGLCISIPLYYERFQTYRKLKGFCSEHSYSTPRFYS